MKPLKDFDYYLRERLVFDTAGFCGAIQAVKISLMELPASRIVFATDYPQEIRAQEAVRDFVRDLRTLGAQGDQILGGNNHLLLKSGSEERFSVRGTRKPDGSVSRQTAMS